MKDGQVKLLLWTSAAVFGAGAVAVLAWGGAGPGDVATADASNAGRATTRPAGAGDPPLTAFEDVWETSFGQPLVPPAPPPAAGPAVAAASPAVPVRLLGTVVEPGGPSMAVLAGPDGRPQWRQVGESVGGAEVVQIDPDQVTVRHGGGTVVLEVQKPVPGQAGAAKKLQ